MMAGKETEMTEKESLELENIVQKLQRDINCLSEDIKTTRRRSIERIRRETTGQQPPLSPDVLHTLLDKVLMKPLLKMVYDPAEKCREVAIAMLSDLMEMIKDHTQFLPYIMPIIVARLGTNEITEPSEEIRLQLICLLSSLVDYCGRDFAPYLHDMVTILRYTVVDPYPEVKKESCTCIIKLSSSISHVFHQESEIIVKSILKSITHQHSKVRLSCIKALGSAIQYGIATPLNDSLPALAQCICDSIPSVRLCTVNVLGEWLLNLIDRYSYHHKLIPLLLTALTDEVESVRNTAHQLWIKVSAKYEQENEDDLKDKIDFVKPIETYPELEYPRPSLGCRVLVYRNFSKIFPAILRDITDWTLNSRIKSAQLLYTLLYHLEDNITHHIRSILDGLYCSCQDEDSIVIKWSKKSAQIIGFYVSPEIWCHLVLPAVRISGGCPLVDGEGSSVAVGPLQCTGYLIVLSSLINGSNKTNIKEYLKSIAECISYPEISQTGHLPLVKELVTCTSEIIKSSANTSSLANTSATNILQSISIHLFTVLLRVLVNSVTDTHTVDTCNNNIILLANGQGYEELHQLYKIHANSILDIVKVDYTNWTIHSPNCSLLISYLNTSHIGPVLSDILHEIIPIISHCTQPDQDPELRLRFISVMIKCILSSSVNSFNQSSISSIITDIIIPSSIWRGGRTAAAIRTAAMTGAQALLQKSQSSQELYDIMPQFLPQVVSCMDDDNTSTRLVSCKVMNLLLQKVPQYFTVDQLHQLYSDLLKRLDDSSNQIRLEMSQTLITYFKTFPTSENYDKNLYKAHIEVIYNGLLIHLDDPDHEIQDAMLLVLQSSSILDPVMLHKMVDDVKDKHRSTTYCKQLLQFLNILLHV